MQYRKILIAINLALAISSPSWANNGLFLKFGPDHLQLDQNSNRIGETALLQGSLGLGADYALGLTPDPLAIATGTTLILNRGITLHKQINVSDINQLITNYAGNIGDTVIPNNSAFPQIRVDNGNAYLTGLINTSGYGLVKTGAGTLVINNNVIALGALFSLKQGGLQINQLLMGDLVTDPGTTLTGYGAITGDAQVAGNIMAGTMHQIGHIQIGTLNLAASANAIFRINPSANDYIQINNDSYLNGNITIAPHGLGAVNRDWVVMAADSLHNSQFQSIKTTVPYLDPVIKYQAGACPHDASQNCDLVIASLRHNNLGLNYAIPQWRAGIINDSRFIRDTAIHNSDSGKPWLHSWFANTEWRNTDRDTSGIQLGNSWRVLPSTYMAAFAGIQNTHWRSGTHISDQSQHIGLALTHDYHNLNIKLGYAHSRHHGQIQRQAAPPEPYIASQPHAQLDQAWARVQGQYNIGKYQIQPYSQITWLQLHSNSVTEHGSMAAVHIPGNTDQLYQGKIGLKYTQPLANQYGMANMYADVSVHKYISGHAIQTRQSYLADANGRGFNTSTSLDTYSAQLDFGVNAKISRHAVINFSYTGQYSQHSRQHGLWLGVNGMFY